MVVLTAQSGRSERLIRSQVDRRAPRIADELGARVVRARFQADHETEVAGLAKPEIVLQVQKLEFRHVLPLDETGYSKAAMVRKPVGLATPKHDFSDPVECFRPVSGPPVPEQMPTGAVALTGGVPAPPGGARWHKACCTPVITEVAMPAPSSTQRQSHLDHLAGLERQLKQERLDLIRSMAAQISAPDVIESHAHALVKLQARLDTLREERARTHPT